MRASEIRHVYVAGLRRSRPLADYLVYGLVRGERPSSLIDFAGGMAGPQISTFGPDDVLVTIAVPPYSQPVVDLVMDAHVSGRRILAITDGADSPWPASRKPPCCFCPTPPAGCSRSPRRSRWCMR